MLYIDVSVHTCILLLLLYMSNNCVSRLNDLCWWYRKTEADGSLTGVRLERHTVWGNYIAQRNMGAHRVPWLALGCNL